MKTLTNFTKRDYCILQQFLGGSTKVLSTKVLSTKKDDSYRFCIDYRRSSRTTLNIDAYPPLKIDDSFDHLAGNKWYSTWDCCSGYWQIELVENDKHKLAFATRKVLLQIRVMIFWLCSLSNMSAIE